MGNRAIVVPWKAMAEKRATVGIYVHWYDDEDLEMALKMMEEKGWRSVSEDEEYGMARLCQLLCDQGYDGGNVGLKVVDFGNPKDVSEKGRYLDEGYVGVEDYKIVWKA